MNILDLEKGMWAAIGVEGQRSYLGEIISMDNGVITIASMSEATGHPLYEERYLFHYDIEDILDFEFITTENTFVDGWGNTFLDIDGLREFVNYWNRTYGFKN